MGIEDQLAEQIIKEQALVIGPLAWEEAGKVSGLKIDVNQKTVHMEEDSKIVLERLVAQYEQLFGVASREVCRNAVRSILSQVPEEKIPAVLK